LAADRAKLSLRQQFAIALFGQAEPRNGYGARQTRASVCLTQRPGIPACSSWRVTTPARTTISSELVAADDNGDKRKRNSLDRDKDAAAS
jgi:hypothetical protein